MAKFNIEIELDWIDEESSVEDAVKQEIIGNIEERDICRSVKHKTLH